METQINGHMFPKRNIVTSLFALAKRNLIDVLEAIANNKIFKVKVENDIAFSIALQKIHNLLSSISQKMSSIKIEAPETKLTLSIPSDDKIATLTEEVGNLSDKTISNLFGIGDLLEKIIGELQGLKNGIPSLKFTPPQIQKVTGEVKVTSIPKTYDFDKLVEELRQIQYAVNKIKIEVPKQKEIHIPEFPKEFSFVESQAILKALKEVSSKLDELPKRFPEMDFPREIAVTNFPPQKYPMPVTNFSINALAGTAKSRTITVTTALTPLPDEVLSHRRSMIIYNNSTQTVEIGGSDFTFGNGLPIPRNTFSPPIDCGEKMIIYGRVTSGTADVRTFEVSDINIGR